MLLAALVAALLAAMGIRGLAASKESLRVVYEDRMEPVRSLSQISHLMLANQLQMQLALARANPQGGIVRLEHISAWQAAEQIEQNVAAIDELWQGYLAVARSAAEQALAQQFGERRGRYLREAVAPALAALRGLDYLGTQRLAANAHKLYEQAYPEIEGLVRLQFDFAEAAYREGVRRYEYTRWLALGALLVSMAVLSWLGLLLMQVFSVKLGWLPVSGYGGPDASFATRVSHLVLPAVVLGLVNSALITRFIRASMLDVLRDDYVRTARAKGLPESRVILKHAVRNALIPILTVLGLTTALLISGAVVTETVFGLPGVGSLVVSAVLRRDYPVIQGALLIIAAIYVLINLFIDLLYLLVDPRVRY